ncbi:MAG: hypothetical protein KC449_16210, partial [Anaerolineales bacterium]|nr:hypothetical protein [Anaerolineales bacterium]
MRLSQLSPMLRALLLTLFLVIFALVFLISANNSQNRAGLQKYEVTLTALASIAQNQVFAIGTLEFELSKTPTPTFTATPTPTHTPTITPIPTDTPTS